MHKSIFPIESWNEILGLILILLISGLTNAGGSGGSALLTPILMMLFNYNANNSIAILYALIFGGAIGNALNWLTRKDPNTQQPAINYNVILIILPLMIFGSTVGVVLGRIISPLIILIGVLAVTAYIIVGFKAKLKTHRSNELLAKQNPVPGILNQEIINTDMRAKLLNIEDAHCPSNIEIEHRLENQDPRLQKLLKGETTRFPVKKILVIIALIIVTLLISTFRGTDSFASILDIPYCGLQYWCLFGLSLVICMSFFFITQFMVRKIVRQKKVYSVAVLNDGMTLTDKDIKSIGLLSALSGFLTGLFGVGGAIVLTKLLKLGISPQSFAATASVLGAMISFVSLFQVALYGDIPLQDQAIFLGIAFVGGFGLSLILNWLVKKYQRPSLILYTVLVTLCLSLIITPVFELYQNWGNLQSLLEFGVIC